MTDVRHKPYGVKRGTKLAYCYAASLAFLLVYKKLGYLSTEILLPFRWGAVDLGAAFYPLTAAVMTVLISAFGLFNRFGTDEESCVGGLCQTVLFVQSAALAVVGDVTDDGGLTAFGYICAAAVGGSLIWGLSPAKLRSGSSGGYFCGAAAAAALCFTERLGLAVLVSCIAAAVDCACTAVQYLVYRISKKLVLKGSSLHSHMSRSGMNDYKIIAVFSLIAAAGGVLAVMYAAYSVKVTL
jgi:phospho-N-acetylmuramoyl-pentapeptide-transferase